MCEFSKDNDEDSERGSIISAMRKTRSIDASCLDMRSIGDVVNSSSMNMPRAKSEFNLTSSVSERNIDTFLVFTFRAKKFFSPKQLQNGINGQYRVAYMLTCLLEKTN